MSESFPSPQPSNLPPATTDSKKRKRWPWVVGAIVLILIIGAAFGEGDKETGGTATAASPTSQAAVPIVAAPAASAAPERDSTQAATSVPPVTTAPPAPAVAPASATPQISSGQRNAARSAQQYIEMSAFSRSGLIEQLEYEGFSTEDATYAADSLHADWNEQAARSAKQYLEMTSFSRSGLVEQLMYEGFTSAQAEYGANAAY